MKGPLTHYNWKIPLDSGIFPHLSRWNPDRLMECLVNSCKAHKDPLDGVSLVIQAIDLESRLESASFQAIERSKPETT